MSDSPPALVSMRGVDKTFHDRRADTVAAHGIDLTIHHGEIVGLVGESGSGKSTVAGILLGLVEPDAGSVEVEGRSLAEWLRTDERGYRGTVQAVFQQPLLALDRRRTVGWSIAEPLLIHRRMTASARRDRVAELLAMVGLEAELADRHPGALSGGQLQRVNIARALALEPRLMVCDEAVSALDVSVQAQVIDLFLDIQQRLGVAMLFISHNMAVVRHISDSMVVMHHGEVVEAGQTDQVCTVPRSDYTRRLLSAWLDPTDRSTSRARSLAP